LLKNLVSFAEQLRYERKKWSDSGRANRYREKLLETIILMNVAIKQTVYDWRSLGVGQGLKTVERWRGWYWMQGIDVGSWRQYHHEAGQPSRRGTLTKSAYFTAACMCIVFGTSGAK